MEKKIKDQESKNSIQKTVKKKGALNFYNIQLSSFYIIKEYELISSVEKSKIHDLNMLLKIKVDERNNIHDSDEKLNAKLIELRTV